MFRLKLIVNEINKTNFLDKRNLLCLIKSETYIPSIQNKT